MEAHLNTNFRGPVYTSFSFLFLHYIFNMLHWFQFTTVSSRFRNSYSLYFCNHYTVCTLSTKAFLTAVGNICLGRILWSAADIWLIHDEGWGCTPNKQFYRGRKRQKARTHTHTQTRAHAHTAGRRTDGNASGEQNKTTANKMSRSWASVIQVLERHPDLILKHHNVAKDPVTIKWHNVPQFDMWLGLHVLCVAIMHSLMWHY